MSDSERQTSPSSEPQAFTTRDLVIAALLGLLVLIASQVPTLSGFRAQKLALHPDLVFNGSAYTYADESATYWSWMRQARDGRFFLTDLYTPEDHPRNYVNLLWWGLGTICRLTGWSIVAVYSAARLVLGALLIALLFRLANRLFVTRGERLACYVVFLLAGGWEGLFRTIGPLHGVPRLSSPSWWMPEISTFFSLMLFPHFLAGFICVVAGTLAMIVGWSQEPGPVRRPVMASIGVGLALAALTFFHPYDAVSLMGALWTAPVLFGLCERRFSLRDWRQPIVATAVWLPSFLYNYSVFTANVAMRAWDLQNLMTTPEVKRLIICLGVGLVLSFLSLFRLSMLSRPQLIMAGWLLSTLVIIHLPLRFQRRMMGGIQFPLAALGVAGVAHVVIPILRGFVRMAGRRVEFADRSGWVCLALVLLMGPAWLATPAYLLFDEWANIRAATYPAWLLKEEVEGLRFLESHAPADSRVLASYDIGNWIPPYTGVRCVLGHYALTISSEEKKKEIARFFSAGADSDEWRRETLERWKVTFVIWTGHERALGGFDPSTAPWLTQVFAAGDDPVRAVRVYAVRDAPASR